MNEAIMKENNQYDINNIMNSMYVISANNRSYHQYKWSIIIS